jgi:nucleoside 2-deoxyribosyltransferase
MNTVYLGGAFAEFTPAQVVAKQAEMEALLGASITCLKPMHQDSYPPELGQLITTTLTQRDYLQIQQSRLLIFDFLGATKVSAGSMIEIGWATEMGKPIVAVAEQGNPNLTNMARNLITITAATRTQAAAVVRTLLG